MRLELEYRVLEEETKGTLSDPLSKLNYIYEARLEFAPTVERRVFSSNGNSRAQFIEFVMHVEAPSTRPWCVASVLYSCCERVENTQYGDDSTGATRRDGHMHQCQLQTYIRSRNVLPRISASNAVNTSSKYVLPP